MIVSQFDTDTPETVALDPTAAPEVSQVLPIAGTVAAAPVADDTTTEQRAEQNSTARHIALRYLALGETGREFLYTALPSAEARDQMPERAEEFRALDNLTGFTFAVQTGTVATWAKQSGHTPQEVIALRQAWKIVQEVDAAADARAMKRLGMDERLLIEQYRALPEQEQERVWNFTTDATTRVTDAAAARRYGAVEELDIFVREEQDSPSPAHTQQWLDLTPEQHTRYTVAWTDLQALHSEQEAKREAMRQYAQGGGGERVGSPHSDDMEHAGHRHPRHQSAQ